MCVSLDFLIIQSRICNTRTSAHMWRCDGLKYSNQVVIVMKELDKNPNYCDIRKQAQVTLALNTLLRTFPSKDCSTWN